MQRIVMMAVLILTTSASQLALGCSLIPMRLRKVPSDIKVVVTHLGKPVAGIRVEVKSTTDNNKRVFSDLTDDSGTVLASGLPAGTYYLTAAHRDFEAGNEWIEVVTESDAKLQKEFHFEWVGWSYETRRVAGTLTGFVPGDKGNKLQNLIHPKKVFYSGVNITLTNAFSDAEYRTVSDSSGGFAFDQIPDGTYILAIDGGMMSVAGRPADATTLVLDLAQNSSRESLPLQLQDNGCYQIYFDLAEK